MKRGIQLEIPNEWGRHLGEVLEPINISNFDWYIGGEEAYQKTGEGEFEPLFQGEIYGMKGQELSEILKSSSEYYIIFANFKAYPQGESIQNVLTYEEFLNSQCQLVLLVFDSSYVALYCKDNNMIDDLYLNATRIGFKNVEYITNENDFRTKLSVW
ncbi:DUF2691 family protein [Paenibacillus glycanilyticus]|uniref:DUF2691 family protein n=1 Tax=Paenibacillus glycanilyticus TaxID=126569 RepID=UPI002041AC72|nr:DUF2691 family protein [Paenibacillus glycanilyticus]MCM3630407.1 DUF2691 family protein [Paenibacillus glycanilyticus]